MGGVVAGHDRLDIGPPFAGRGRNGDGNAAVEVGQQDHPAGALAGEIDAPDHAARIHHRLARQGMILAPRIQDHGLQKRTAGPADHPRQDGVHLGIGHGMQQRLVTAAPGPAAPSPRFAIGAAGHSLP